MTDATNKIKILAVDDSKVMRKAMSKVLGKDYEVVEAEHGEDAWTLLMHDETIQVVFTDLSMPYLDGFGLLKRIREAEDERFHDMPVIIITGKEDDDETKQLALERGASDFITKPFDSVQLQARAKAHVNFEKTTKKLNETQHKLEQQSAIDKLTGLGGRRYFCKAGEESLSYCIRHEGQFVVLRMDIDNFNTIFIANGKEFADNIIKQVGARLAGLCRKEDMVARVGLAKFAMLLRDTDMDSALQLAERTRNELNKLEFMRNNQVLNISVSIGLLEPKLHDDSRFEDLVAETEKYMSMAVEKGGNQIVVKSLRKESLQKQIDISTALKLIHEDNTEFLADHTDALVRQLLPLLNFLSEHIEGNISDSLKIINQELLTVSKDRH